MGEERRFLGLFSRDCFSFRFESCIWKKWNKEKKNNPIPVISIVTFAERKFVYKRIDHNI